MRLIDADALLDAISVHLERIEQEFEDAPTIAPVKEKDFVDEIIWYIFAYPDDDYMTIETLCRKLYKHGLIDKKDGEWICPQTEEEFEEPNYYDPALWE